MIAALAVVDCSEPRSAWRIGCQDAPDVAAANVRRSVRGRGQRRASKPGAVWEASNWMISTGRDAAADERVGGRDRLDLAAVVASAR